MCTDVVFSQTHTRKKGISRTKDHNNSGSPSRPTKDQNPHNKKHRKDTTNKSATGGEMKNNTKHPPPPSKDPETYFYML